MSDDTRTQGESAETPPPGQNSQSVSRSTPPAVPPFGGGYAESIPPKRRGKGLMTCLVIAGVFFALVFIGLLLVTFVASSLWEHRPIIRGSNTVGLVRIEDEIQDSSKILEVIDHYQKADDIRAVLVRVDSPGGRVGASQEIYEALKRLRAKGKVVVASMSNIAASGGYYVACGAQEIYSVPGTLTGSIGVMVGLPNIQEINKRIGFQYETLKSGKFKDIGSMTRPLTAEEKQLLQGVIDDTYGQFIEAILSQRKKQLEKALENIGKSDPTIAQQLGAERTPEKLLRVIADGRIFTGRRALDYGLVDKIGTGTDALERAGQLAGIAKPELYEYKPRRTLRDILESSAKSAIGSMTMPLKGLRLEYRMPF